jgi:hypothetical protein
MIFAQPPYAKTRPFCTFNFMPLMFIGGYFDLALPSAALRGIGIGLLESIIPAKAARW